MSTRLVMLGALLLPALASAQPPPNDPDAQPAPVIVTPPSTVVQPSGPPGYREVVDSYNAPVFASGALVFAGTYGASVITAATTDGSRGNNRLYVPVVGPWLALNDWGNCPITNSACDTNTTDKVLLVADGVFQAAGIIGMLDGLLQPSSHREIVLQAKVDTKVRVRPIVVSSAGDHGPGLALGGHF